MMCGLARMGLEQQHQPHLGISDPTPGLLRPSLHVTRFPGCSQAHSHLRSVTLSLTLVFKVGYT